MKSRCLKGRTTRKVISVPEVADDKWPLNEGPFCEVHKPKLTLRLISSTSRESIARHHLLIPDLSAEEETSLSHSRGSSPAWRSISLRKYTLVEAHFFASERHHLFRGRSMRLQSSGDHAPHPATVREETVWCTYTYTHNSREITGLSALLHTDSSTSADPGRRRRIVRAPIYTDRDIAMRWDLQIFG